MAPDAVDVELRRDQLVAACHVDAEEALVAERRRADAQVHFLRAVPAQKLDDRSARRSAHDRIVDNDHTLALKHVAERVVLERYALLAQLR